MTSPLAHPSVAMVVDHPHRDLAGVVLTARLLVQAGITCHLVPLNLQDRELLALAPDLAVLNYFRHENAAIARRLADAGVRLAVVDTEGGVWQEYGHYEELLWTDHSLRASIAVACMWGPRMLEETAARGLLAPEQMAATGCPRFDLYHAAWRPVLSPTGNGPRQVLLNTNFSVSNPRFTDRDRNLRTFRESAGWDESRLQAYVADESRAIAGTLELARALHADFPGVPIVLRPHPFEALETYREPLASLPGITVENDRPVQLDIARSAVVIQRSCSTAIEAGLAGVPALSPQWLPAPALIAMAEAVSRPCAQYAELRGAVAQALATPTGGGEPPPALDRVIADWFLRADGAAHARVAERLMAALPGTRTVDEDACRRSLYGLEREAPALERVGRTVRHWLSLGPDWSFRERAQVGPGWWDNSAKAFRTGTVIELLERMEACHPTPAGTRVVEVRDPASAGRYRTRIEGRSITLVPGARR